MKLSQLQEARYGGKETPVHYFEYYPHYRGTLFRDFETSIEAIDSFVRDLAERGDDTWEDVEERLGDAYAISDVIQDWPAIRKQLQQKGEWVDMWEEGTHALSTKGRSHALQLLKDYERDVVYSDTDAYDELDDLYGALSEFPSL